MLSKDDDNALSDDCNTIHMESKIFKIKAPSSSSFKGKWNTEGRTDGPVVYQHLFLLQKTQVWFPEPNIRKHPPAPKDPMPSCGNSNNNNNNEEEEEEKVVVVMNIRKSFG